MAMQTNDSGEANAGGHKAEADRVVADLKRIAQLGATRVIEGAQAAERKIWHYEAIALAFGVGLLAGLLAGPDSWLRRGDGSA